MNVAIASSVISAEVAARPSPRASVLPSTVTPQPLRLTRRGRLAVFAGALAALGCLSVGLGDTSSASPEPRQAVEIQVGSGDSLWSIADRFAGPGEIPAVINEIKAANGLSGPELVEGQRLVVPVG